jgi:hypothetical protein
VREAFGRLAVGVLGCGVGECRPRRDRQPAGRRSRTESLSLSLLSLSPPVAASGAAAALDTHAVLLLDLVVAVVSANQR